MVEFIGLKHLSKYSGNTPTSKADDFHHCPCWHMSENSWGLNAPSWQKNLPVTCASESPEKVTELFLDQVKDLKWKESSHGLNLLDDNWVAYQQVKSKFALEIHSIYKKINFRRSELWPVKISSPLHVSSSLKMAEMANVLLWKITATDEHTWWHWEKSLFCLLASFPGTISFLILSNCKQTPQRITWIIIMGIKVLVNIFWNITPSDYGYLFMFSVALSSSHVSHGVLLTIFVPLTILRLLYFSHLLTWAEVLTS